MNDILTSIPVAEGVIPGSVENFSEAAMYVIENTENEFNDLLEEMGMIDEDGVFIESYEDDEVFNEGLGDVKDRFVNILENLWSSIKSFFEKVIAWFKEKASAAKEFLDEQINRVKDKLEDRRQAKIYKKFGDVKVDDIPSEDFKKMPKVHRTNLGNLIIELGKVVANYTGTASVGYAKIDLAMNSDSNDNKKTLKKMCVDLAGDDNAQGVATMKQILKKKATGELREVGKDDFDKCYRIVFNNKNRKEIKSLYNQARKGIKDSISCIKQIKDKDNAKEVATAVRYYKSANQIIHAAHAVLCEAAKQQFNEATRTLGYMARAAAKAAKKKKKANAASEFESLFGF